MTTSKVPLMAIRQWEIWQANWRHEDDGTCKPRTVLVLSPASYNETHDHIWAIKISGEKHSVPLVFELNPLDPAFAGTGLTKTSYFYLQTARKILQSEFLYQRGRLNPMSQTFMRLLIENATGRKW